MKAVEFCYWLQGLFEICDADGDFCPDSFGFGATKCIKAHLALVAQVDPLHRNAFVLWLDMHMKERELVGPDDVRVIRETLAAQFKHDIDPSYAGDAKKLQQIHDGPKIGGVGPDGQLYRC